MELTEQQKFAQEFAKKGGDAVKEKYGSEHYAKIVKIRWDKYREQKKLSTGTLDK